MSETTRYKFSRRCDITGNGMNEGYCFMYGEGYAKDKDSALKLAQSLGYSNLEDAYKDETYFYTEWTELDSDEWYESEYEDGRDAIAVSPQES